MGKNKDSSKFLVSFEKSIILNNINLFTENRENKSKDTFHNQSLERVPTNINIKGSNNLEKWRNVIENAEINFNKNKSNYNFINQNKYKYYLIDLKNNENIIRLYQIRFNHSLMPSNFKEVE